VAEQISQLLLHVPAAATAELAKEAQVRLLAGAYAAILTVSILPQHAFAQDSAAPERNITVTACVIREADYTRSTSPPATPSPSQLLLADADSGRATYSLTGTRESELLRYVGQRVEITGTLERPRTTPVLTAVDGTRTGSVNSAAAGAAGVTPEGGAAHEPSDAVAATIRAGQVNEPAPASSDPAYQVATLPRLNAASARSVSGTCAQLPRQEVRPVVASNAQQSAPAATPVGVAAPKPQMVRGCLARQTAGGTALSPQVDPGDSLVLVSASLVSAQPAPIVSAVPGSVPAGAGSGTVPNTAGTTGTAPVDAGKLTFALTVAAGRRAELAGHVGQRIEVVGIVDEAGGGARQHGDAVEQRRGVSADGTRPGLADTAHPSAPTQRMAVSSFRALGGECR
jgi:hypothetical protein